jgi:site-specific DNA-methyltransferase (adenine-specific)
VLTFRRGQSVLYNADVSELYAAWDTPVVIVSDGAYGIGGFAGDPAEPEALPEWYEPHVKAWSAKATPLTTLWFWNTEVGWANVHPVLIKHGWQYTSCNIWDKGIGHVAGNSNTSTLRKFPVVTEVCVQYAKRASFNAGERRLTMKEWLRYEWERTGLPLQKANSACGVKVAASRKYLARDGQWYFPPSSAFERLAAYANQRGDPGGRPYFALDGQVCTGERWSRMRPKFACPVGITNVWLEPAVRGSERLKQKRKCAHLNQKPLRLFDLIVRVSSDEGDVVWEPFGGLCTGAIAAYRLKRRSHSAELRSDFYHLAAQRLQDESCAALASPG